MAPTDATALDWTTVERGDAHFRRKQLAVDEPGTGLGCSLYEVPPGESTWPYHYHTGNDEALYVLEGTGRLRTPDGTHPVAADTFAAFPTGEAGAHRLHNDGDEDLRVLVVSEMNDPDVTVYPDSGTIGVFAGSPPGGRTERTVEGFYDRDATVDYWEE